MWEFAEQARGHGEALPLPSLPPNYQRATGEGGDGASGP